MLLAKAVQEDEGFKDLRSIVWIGLYWVSIVPLAYIMLVLPVYVVLSKSGALEIAVLLSFVVALPMAAVVTLYLFWMTSDVSFKTVLRRARANYEMSLAVANVEVVDTNCQRTKHHSI